MIGKILAAALGSSIDRKDGDSGVKGALLGVIGAGLVKRALPIGLLIGGGLALKRAVDRRRAAPPPAM